MRMIDWFWVNDRRSAALSRFTRYGIPAAALMGGLLTQIAPTLGWFLLGALGALAVWVAWQVRP